MDLRRIGFVVVAALTSACQDGSRQRPAALSSATWQWNASSTPDPVTWSRVMDWAFDQGFQPLEPATPYGAACWRFNANVEGERTTLYVGPHGRIYEEFPPGTCNVNGNGGQRSQDAALPRGQNG